MAGDAALDALYQEVILDHNRRPRNYHEMPGATCSADGKNPNCGDALTVWLKVDDDRVSDISFQGVGCAISKASASLMTVSVKGKTRGEVTELYEKVHALVTGTDPAAATDKSLGPIRALSGVSRFPMRVKCASLSWHAMKAALDGTATVVSTDDGKGAGPDVGLDGGLDGNGSAA
jgi:nitrogen fixation NifU-like protein